jgi:beta-barrel assembly-enhancing protease
MPESNADLTGSDICAEAGYNPWGLIWLFKDFQSADVTQLPQLLSDHPADGTRIQTLENHFRDNASTFSKFSSDSKSASPFSVPKDAPVVFLRPDTKTAK